MFTFNPIREFFPQSWWGRDTTFFTYGCDFNTLSASAALESKEIQISTDSDFLCLSVSRIITTDAAAGTEQSFAEQLIRVYDASAGNAWMNAPQHLDNFAGRMSVDGNGPHRLPVPRLARAGTSLTVELQNLEASARRIWIAFHGMKIYHTRNANRHEG